MSLGIHPESQDRRHRCTFRDRPCFRSIESWKTVWPYFECIQVRTSEESSSVTPLLAPVCKCGENADLKMQMDSPGFLTYPVAGDAPDGHPSTSDEITPAGHSSPRQVTPLKNIHFIGTLGAILNPGAGIRHFRSVLILGAGHCCRILFLGVRVFQCSFVPCGIRPTWA